jgi:hypothetical protein
VIRARIRWGGYESQMGERRGVYKVFLSKHEGESHLEELGVDGRIILQWIFKKWDGEGIWTGFIWLRVRTDGRIL